MENELSQIATNIRSVIHDHESTPETIHEYDLVISYLQGAPIQDTRDTWKGTKGKAKAMELAIDENMKKEKKSKEEIVPKQCQVLMSVFSDEEAARFPDRRPWDHAIVLKEGFQ